ncbi:hypothetical protein GCM10011345_36960 [Gemmobacter megaterium]|nr:hypothetical protein GCM10011345_36960 [Gemmobacter megaterium]
MADAAIEETAIDGPARQPEGTSAQAPADFDLDALEAAFEGLEAEAAAEAAAEPVEEQVETAVAGDEPDLEALLTSLTEAVATEAVAEAETGGPDVTPSVSDAQDAGVEDEAPSELDEVDSLIARLAERANRPAPAATEATVESAEAALPAPSGARIIKVRRARPEAAAPVADADDLRAALDAGSEDVTGAPDEPAAPAEDAIVASPETAGADTPEAEDLSVAAPPSVDRVRPARPVPVRPKGVRPTTPRPDGSAAPRAATAPVSPARPVRPQRVRERNVLEREAVSDDAAVDRLIRQANTEMEGAETRRRTSTIAHLKAAVAATVADRMAPGGASRTADTTAAYRNDLADVVRPRRTEGDATDGRKGSVAPLVLVSAQRIDRPSPVAAANSQTRSRPMANTALALQADEDPDDDDDMAQDHRDNLFGGAGGLPEYLAHLGVTDLTDRMEAAGAWLMAAEGRDSFNRPQLMKLSGSNDLAATREEALIAFGVLLREGRLVRPRRGFFALPDESEALAAAKRYAG